MTTGRIRPADAPLLAAVAEAAVREAGLSGRTFADPGLLGDFLAHAVEAARSGRRLSAAALSSCSESGARAARLGIAPRVAVDLYLSAAWLLWRDGPDLRPEPDGTSPQADARTTPGINARTSSETSLETSTETRLRTDSEHGQREAALWLIRAADDGVAALIEGFQEARAGIVRMEASARQELVEALLAGGQQAQSSLARAEAMGLSMTGPMVVLVAGSRPPFSPAVAPRLAPDVERALQGRFSDSLPLVTLHDDALLVIAAAPDREAVNTIASAVVGVLRSRLGDFGSRTAGWRAAVSMARSGPWSVSSGYQEAREALDFAFRAGLPDPVAYSHDLVVQRVLLRDREAAWDLVETTLSGLTGARDGGRELLATLLAYFDNAANTTATATAMHLSVRAVSYRLQRVHSLTGRNPNDARQWLALHTAAATAALLGWPDEHRP